ncbi:hypothetical protein SAMN05444920_104752 [Nonomuraea solani]|uniref:CU044_5270 family protein n=1 Tax=Nonomuraea solani TaxID=1144553 RepID=A0A1H6D336_9ACTN|nr:CU044_5270 family protein [Nonomuraea solani]SEG79799.1 hypothetical protein SAMN05444920_104752 [Nonomuraea solani]
MKEFQLIDDVMPDVPPADETRTMAVRARVLAGPRRLPAFSRAILAAAAVSLVLVGGYVAVPMLGGSEINTAATPEPAAVLDAAADRLAAQPPGAGEWWRREMEQVSRIRTKADPTFVAEWRVKDVLWVNRLGRRQTDRGEVSAKPFTPADERAWKEAGSPELCPAGDKCQLGRVYFSSLGLSLDPVPELPTEAGALKAELLRQLTTKEPGDENGWLWAAGKWLLLDTESTPGTRAAVYRMLAGLPGVQVADGVTDLDGRAGVALTYDDRGLRHRILIDRDGGELLAVQDESVAEGKMFESYLVKRLGWTDEAPRPKA